jgi:predicted NACHT family NTPase
VYQLTEEVITKEYDNDKFLTEVIEPGKSRRIAIIGEPGAGKTTLQEKIAVWIHENNKGLPICIPLGGLQGKSSKTIYSRFGSKRRCDSLNLMLQG